jgi:DNA-binding CsgD family transcriptional regulator
MANPPGRTAAALLVECLAAEGCEYVFSVPGEETMDILEALSHQDAVRHITTRHEQGAAFMADVYGRLTGRASVAMSTLGPGATNLVTGIADAYLDRAPMVALTGQAGSDKTHKEAHQFVDIVRMLEPVTKWNQRVGQTAAIPEIMRKAFRVAQLAKPGPTHDEGGDAVAEALMGLGRLGLSDAAIAAWIRSVEEVAARTPRPDLVWSGPEVPGVHARDTRRDGYEVVLQNALELHGDQEPFERARTELCLGRRRRHSRHRAAARVVLHQALSRFDALGAELWAGQARAELRATGETPAPRPGGSLMTLTPQELQVALVVAGGATNKEAGASLFISPKTVEFHLGHVYGKLGVRSRTELVPKVAALS